jgi:hypothetical protein
MQSEPVRGSRYTCRVNRLVAIGLVIVAGCAKREAAPAKQESAAPAPASATDPATAAKEAARASGVLGPTTADFEKGAGPADTGPTRSGGDIAAQPVTGGAPPAGKLTFGKVELAGKKDGAVVTAALTKRLDELQACYQDTLGNNPTLTGELTFAFTLKANGAFDAVSVSSSTLKDESLETCLLDSVKAAKLDKPMGKVPVKGSITIAFQPS